MSGEERFGADLVVQVLDDGPREAEAVEGAGAATDFIEDDQAALGGVVEDVSSLAHFDHEGGLATGQVITGADASENAVHEVNACLRSRDERTGVREQSQQGDLPNISAL